MRARSFGLLLLALCGAGAGAEPAHRRLGRERGRRRAKARVNRGPSKRWERREGASEDGVPLCEDTCASARNGVCEDGSLLMRRLRINQDGVTRVPGTVSRLLCDLGTDCADCGPSPPLRGMASLAAMMPAARPSPAPRPAPHPETDHRVAYLRSRSVEVRAAWTLTQPAFIMPFTDPRDDFDVSRAMQEKRVVEPLYNVYWSRLSRQCCADGGLMLDVGSNFGYYALYAAKLGCRVVAWEPVPVFRAFVEAGAALNNLSHRIHLRPAVVSDSAGEVLNMTVPEHGIWGTASVGGLNVDPSIRSKTYSVPASTETLDQMVAEAACIMKLDVEGFEPQVLKGAAETLRRRPPRAILTEYTPGVMERARKWDELARYPESLRTFAKAGYQIWHLFGTHKNSEAMLRTNWAEVALPKLPEVAERGMRAEDINARNMVVDMRKGPGFSVPWDLHPHSLHAEFAHNTDLLLTLNRSDWSAQQLVLRSREVGVHATGKFGLGGGHCTHVVRDGTASEVIGRLCLGPPVPGGVRARSIDTAVKIAELARPLVGAASKQAWHRRVYSLGKQYTLSGAPGSRGRTMQRTERRERRGGGAAAAGPSVGAAGAIMSRAGGGRGRGHGGRGRGRGRGRAQGLGLELSRLIETAVARGKIVAGAS